MRDAFPHSMIGQNVRGTMKACLLHSIAPIETNPLDLADTPLPQPQGDQVLVHVNACGVCRTDLHVIEANCRRANRLSFPGHQIVGRIEQVAASA